MLLLYFIPTAVPAPKVSRPRELKTCVADAVHLAFTKRVRHTTHVPWRYFPQTLHRWFVKSGGLGV